MAYVPEAQRDTRWWIWNSLFKCRVPHIQMMSTEYLQHFGMPASGDGQTDKETANELITTMLTIKDMIEYFNKGVVVRVVNYADTKTIYERISNHLQAWKVHLETSLNTRDAPLEDLIAMDKFAVAVYAHAKYQFTTEMVDSIMARQMSGLARNRRTAFVGQVPAAVAKRQQQMQQQPQTEDTPAENPEDKFPERESLADVFARRRSTSVRTWR